MDVMSEEFFSTCADELATRVKPQRLKHVEGVVETAHKLASTYGVDVGKARLAALLHDWDKSYRNNAIRERVDELGIEDEIGSWVVENLPEVLHGPSAAAALSRRYPDIPQDVIHAIKVHTFACVDMTDLDKVIYIADAIEPNRNFDEADALRSLVGKVTLDELYREVYKRWLRTLIDKDVVMHPDTIDIWNNMIFDRSRECKKKYD